MSKIIKWMITHIYWTLVLSSYNIQCRLPLWLERYPSDILRLYSFPRHAWCLIEIIQELCICTEVCLSLDVFYHTLLLHSPKDINLSYSCLFGYFLRTKSLTLVFLHIFDYSLSPPWQIGSSSQIRKRPLRRSYFALFETQLITHSD
jgi:hypothetical protein